MLDRDPFTLTDHQRAILGAVLASPGMRRAELTERLGISPQTTMRAVNPMVEAGTLSEDQIASGGRGKPASVLSYCQGACLTMGISLAVDRVRVRVSDLTGSKVSSIKVSKSYSSAQEQLRDLDQSIDKTLAEIPVSAALVGIGVSVQGYFLDERTRFSAKADPSGWASIDLKQHLETRLGVPVRMMNDGRTLAASLLINSQSTDYFCIHLGSGIGGGVVLNGTLVEGVHGNAGEIGQLFPVDKDRPTEPHFLKAAGRTSWKGWQGQDALPGEDAVRFEAFMTLAASKIESAIETALVLLDFDEVYLCSRMPIDILEALSSKLNIAPLGTLLVGSDQRLLNPPPKVHPRYIPNHAKLASRMALDAFLSPVGDMVE